MGSGDAVWSFDFQTGQWVVCRVAVCHSAEYDGQFLTIIMESGIQQEVTADHPIWVIEGDALADRPQLKHRDAYEDSGLALPGRWVHSQFLRVGDQLHSREGNSRIEEIRSREDCLPVYDLSVLGLPYYSVSPIGLLVHNTETPGTTPNSGANRPPNMSPPGAGRQGAFNAAKRANGVPESMQPTRVLPKIDRRGNIQPGKVYEFDVPAPGGGTRTVRIRDDAAGHNFGPNDPQNRGPHFNDEAGNHYDY